MNRVFRGADASKSTGGSARTYPMVTVEPCIDPKQYFHLSKPSLEVTIREIYLDKNPVVSEEDITQFVSSFCKEMGKHHISNVSEKKHALADLKNYRTVTVIGLLVGLFLTLVLGYGIAGGAMIVVMSALCLYLTIVRIPLADKQNQIAKSLAESYRHSKKQAY
jgi:hypothetical protein